MRNALLALLLLPLLAAGGRADTYTYVDLVKRLTSLEALATLPMPGEKCAQASSYDRHSVYDQATGKYVAWDANGDGDGGGLLPVEDGRIVMADIQGPGCIWRTWSAAPGDGHVRIYLDGAAEPAVDLPFKGYFDLQNAPFTYPSLVHDASSGKNCYVPIPFQKSCRIVADRNWGAYYQFTYATYPAGTVLPTFTRDLSLEDRTALEAADTWLSSRLGTDPAGKRRGEKVARKRATIKPGTAAVVADLKGPRAITAIRVKAKFATKDEECAALRELALRIRWDGEAQPSVWAPLGDFFGTAPGVNLFRSFPLGMAEDGFYSFWYMPFATGAVVEVVNDGQAARRIEVSVTHAPLAQPADALGRFHAKWHRDALLPAEPERQIDWPMLKAEGRGRYCGVMLHVWNPKGDWWGEGDEKFFVDGEKLPSTFGTGSEDFFGYAWCNPTPFQKVYHDQTLNSGGNRGHIAVDRWSITDNVPFQTGFEGDIEKYFPNDRPTLYACTAYWYQASGEADPYAPAPVADRLGYFEMPKPRPVVKGAIEGETMKVLEVTAGKTETQDLATFGPDWSKDAHLWWTGAKPGARLTLSLPVAKAGRYTLAMQLTKAPDYGIVQVWVDDRKIGDPLDLYASTVVATGEVDFGVQSLTAGEHRLAFEIVGANEKAIKAYMCGLDYVKLAPAR